ncbi:MAG: hypothetical protein ABI002_08855 [Saprospiraceae bacterium]
MEDSEFQTHAFRHSESVVCRGKLYPIGAVDFDRGLIGLMPTYNDDHFASSTRYQGYIWVKYQDLDLQPYRSAYPDRSVRMELIE